ncbi:MAG TPA: amidase family protein [Fimbriimonadaceae bacterium]|nr:amidase family protein [Fimbriimonadaceae bacterium]
MTKKPDLTRKEFLRAALVTAAVPALVGSVGAGPLRQQQGGQTSDITVDDLKTLEKMIGIEFTDDERKEVLRQVQQFTRGYESIRDLHMDNSVPPATAFIPQGKQPAAGKATSVVHRDIPGISKPSSDEDVAFMTVAELSQLVKHKKISPVELTEIYLKRIDAYGEKLLNVITPTHDLARAQAKKAQEEIAAGNYRGPLHGLPYGLKDLYAVKGYPTTWGSGPHKDQVLDYNCAVYDKLTEAGAVLVGKLSMGALAMNDVWFKGRTKDPWDPTQGSSGSSAGPASCMAAGMVAFSIGTETQGSIVSPSHKCRVTGLRPTFGRVSRYGAMTLSWTMDKAGPICRTAEDCMLVLAAIHGADVRDPGSVDRPLHWSPDVDISSLKIGVLEQGQPLSGDTPSDDYIELLKKLGAKPESVKFSQLQRGVMVDLSVEAAAAFDDFTTSGKIHGLENSFWPQIFRAYRYVTAVESLQALRARSLAMKTIEEEFGDYDMVFAPDRGSFLLLNTNRTGHPQMLMPYGTNDKGAERSVSVYGRLYDEAKIAAVVWKMQQETEFYKLRPDLSKA